VFPLFSLDAPGSARFAQETPDRIRITQESRRAPSPACATDRRGWS